jgi:tRNA1Val (adenine37-N6)-methyltransferase
VLKRFNSNNYSTSLVGIKMPNNYFQFKQFLIKQDTCAMKVCTDACLFGAWVAATIAGYKIKADRVLDIGTGTGLLSLMLAQQIPDAAFDAVEIDMAAAEQATENFAASPWNNRLHVHANSIQQFAVANHKKYNVIICNPPFYENSLKSSDPKKNIALHSDRLTLQDLLIIADKLLEDDGNFFILLPHYRLDEFLQLIKEYFSVARLVTVRQTPKHSLFRSIIQISRQAIVAEESAITIAIDTGAYTNEFIELLRVYYTGL